MSIKEIRTPWSAFPTCHLLETKSLTHKLWGQGSGDHIYTITLSIWNTTLTGCSVSYDWFCLAILFLNLPLSRSHTLEKTLKVLKKINCLKWLGVCVGIWDSLDIYSLLDYPHVSKTIHFTICIWLIALSTASSSFLCNHTKTRIHRIRL
jgi:hypothetical protein